jgi:hypothetical protein
MQPPMPLPQVKFKCTIALRNASGHWLKPQDGVTVADLRSLMAAAYLFDYPEASEEITRELVLHHDGSYISNLPDEVGSIVPWQIFCG